MRLDNFPLVLWINLDRCHNRRSYMQNLMTKYALRAVRITAIDACDKNFQSVCRINSGLSLAENACTCSHLKAMKYFVESTTQDQVVIFEDDVDFAFLPFVPYDWSKFQSELPTDYDLVQLAVTHINICAKIHLQKITPGVRFYCSTAYLITRTTAQKLLETYVKNDIYHLEAQTFATADSMITHSGNVYSIPIFTYHNMGSTIHPNHESIHSKNRKQQLMLWRESNGQSNHKTFRKLSESKH